MSAMSKRGRLLVSLFVIALLIAAAVPVVSMARMMMGRPTATVGQLANLAAGDSIDVALAVDTSPVDGLASGTVLEQVDSATYRRTERALRLEFSTRTTVVMGQLSDVHDGAVIQAQGQLTSADELALERIVILTGLVRVE